MFGDTFNALSASTTRARRTDSAKARTTTISKDNGLTFCCGVGAAANPGPHNPLMHPFPVLASGSRFVTPAGSSLGSDIPAGQGFTGPPPDYNRSRSGTSIIWLPDNAR